MAMQFLQKGHVQLLTCLGADFAKSGFGDL